MEQNMKPKVRTFGGKTEFTLDYSTPETLAASKQERHFHQRMLRAYLKGATKFNFGFRYVGAQRIPNVYEVLVVIK